MRRRTRNYKGGCESEKIFYPWACHNFGFIYGNRDLRSVSQSTRRDENFKAHGRAKNPIKRNTSYNTSYEPGNKGKEQKFIATVTLITPPLSEPATIRTIRWSIDNLAGLLEPQTYGGVSFELDSGHSCLAVPLSAMADNVRSSVFVVHPDGTLEKRAIQTGADDGKYVEIISGLKAEEIVVTSGMNGLTDGAKVDIELENK